MSCVNGLATHNTRSATTFLCKPGKPKSTEQCLSLAVEVSLPYIFRVGCDFPIPSEAAPRPVSWVTPAPGINLMQSSNCRGATLRIEEPTYKTRMGQRTRGFALSSGSSGIITSRHRITPLETVVGIAPATHKRAASRWYEKHTEQSEVSRGRSQALAATN